MYDGDIDFDDEIDVDEAIDAFLSMLKETESEDLVKGIVSIPNPERYKTSKGIFEIFKKMFERRKDVKVYMRRSSSQIANMPKGVYICVEGKDLSFFNTEWFAGAVRMGDNFEVYAKLDGSIHLSIGIGISEVHILDEGDE